MFRHFVDVPEQLHVAGSLFDASPGKHPPLGLDQRLDGGFRHLPEGSGVVDEARDVGRHETVDHAAGPDGFPGEDARVDSRLGVVSDEAADELHAGLDFAVGIFHRDFAVGVFQVAVTGAGAEVDPASEVAVSEKAVVLLVGKQRNLFLRQN